MTLEPLPVPGGSTGEIGTESCCNRTRDNNFKLKESLFKVGKVVFRMRLVNHWHRLPRNVMHAPSLEAFKARLNGALNNKV